MEDYRKRSKPITYIENDTDLYHTKPGETNIELILGPLNELLTRCIACFTKLYGPKDERFLLLEKEALISSIRIHIRELDRQRKESVKYCASCHTPITPNCPTTK